MTEIVNQDKLRDLVLSVLDFHIETYEKECCCLRTKDGAFVAAQNKTPWLISCKAIDILPIILKTSMFEIVFGLKEKSIVNPFYNKSFEEIQIMFDLTA